MRTLLAIICILHCASAAPLLATTRTVTNLNDAGAGSLRQRIIESVANDTINFSVAGTITLTTAELLLNKNLTISGPGAAVLTVKRSTAGGIPQFRIFHIAQGFNVTISGLRVANGNAPASNNQGGAIFNDRGTLTVAGCTISGNSAIGSNSSGNTNIGGGISNSGGTLSVTNSTISGNSASNSGGNCLGGGIINGAVFDEMGLHEGMVTISNTTISGNSADFGGGIANFGTATIRNSTISTNTASSGGGIYDQGSGGSTSAQVTITDSTISGNAASTNGGGFFSAGEDTVNATNTTIAGNTGTSGAGFYISSSSTVNLTNSTVSGNTANKSFGSSSGGFCGGFYNGGTLNVTNSTISGNTATSNDSSRGGGIYNGGTLNLTNSTISSNTSSSGNSTGGGIFNSWATVNVRNTIIALNTATTGPDVDGALISYGFNLIGNDSASTITPTTGDEIGTPGSPIDPLLGQLANNGGPTKTHALLSGSPAINGAGPNAPSRDQRGYIRPDTADMGAFEFGAAVPVTLANISTRAVVQTGNNVLIAGIIITGGNQKSVIVRALGPTLGQPPFNLPGVLANPTMELRDSTGALITANDNWGDAPNNQAITDSGYAPPNSLESAVLTTLNPGNYTAIVRGVNNGTGIALVEVYDLDDPTTASKLGNISTRAFVQTGNNVMIAGVIVHGPDTENVIIRGLGPTLGQAPFNVPNALQDPTLELRDVNGNLIRSNDNWKDTQQTEIQASGYAPPNGLESAVSAALAPSNYTAILRGKSNTTGNALVEVYSLN